MRNLFKTNPAIAKEYMLEYMTLTINGQDVNGFFTTLRVEDELPKGLKTYEIRHDDEDFDTPISLEKHVAVNHYGTFITDNTTILKNKKSVEIEDWDYSEWDEECCHQFVETCYGEVMLKPSDNDGCSECYIGDNFDEYIGEIELPFDTDDIDQVDYLLSEII